MFVPKGSLDNDSVFVCICLSVKPLRPRPNRRHFADHIFKCIFENENERISPRISLKFVPKDRINNIAALVQIMAWRRPGDKPLSEPMMISLLTHICVTRPQWVNGLAPNKQHQVITWTRCNHDLWHYMASLDHNELIVSFAIRNIMRTCPQHICSYSGNTWLCVHCQWTHNQVFLLLSHMLI